MTSRGGAPVARSVSAMLALKRCRQDGDMFTLFENLQKCYNKSIKVIQDKHFIIFYSLNRSLIAKTETLKKTCLSITYLYSLDTKNQSNEST